MSPFHLNATESHDVRVEQQVGQLVVKLEAVLVGVG